MRLLPTLCLTGALVAATPAAAFAHAELVPWQLPPGETAGLLLLITHGCGDDDEWLSTEPLEEEPTVAVTVLAPLELTIEPAAYEGWTLTTERDGTDRVTSATWRSDDPAGTSDTLQLPLDVTVVEVPDGSEVWLPVIQECTGGESLAWTLEGDLRGGDEVPAMRLLVNDDAAAPVPWAEGGPRARGEATSSAPRPPGGLGLPSILLAIGGAAALAAGLLARRRRRRRA